jgi:nickel-type superoxide dismutase maturation protease
MRIRAIAALAGLAILVARRLDVVEVRGRSMVPSLQPGDRLLVVRASPRIGDVVVVGDPRDPSRELIKRVARIGPGGIALRGDNVAGSTDGRTFGDVPAHVPTWRAILRTWPLERIGLIRRRAAAVEPIVEGGEPACSVPEALIVGHEGR